MLTEFITIVALILIIMKIISKLTLGRCISPVCLVGKTVLITGGNSGIGFETALQLAGRGCRVIIADKDNGDQSKEKIIFETNNKNIVAKQFDLASLSSVRNLAQDIIKNEKRLDILINNVGVLGLDSSYTEDGLHLGMQVNHFGSFLLTHLLIDLLKQCAPSRIIFVSSATAYYSNLKAEELNSPPRATKLCSAKFMEYCNTKLCNIISARGFADKLKGTGVTSNSLYPGVVRTPLLVSSKTNVFGNFMACAIWSWAFHVFKLYSKSSLEGAQTTVYLAIAKEVESITGKYFMDCKTFFTPFHANNIDFSNQIWKLSEDFVKLSNHEKLQII